MSRKGGDVPKGYRLVDKTAMRGKLENLNPVEKSLQSIMVRDERHKSENQIEGYSKPEYRKVKKLSDVISNNIQAANDLRSVTHYIKRAEQIWTTLLLKPNGDQKQLLRYDTESSDIKNEKLHDGLIQIVKNYFTTKYPFEDMLPQIIKDVLFRTGSYSLLNLSHSALDHLINGQEISGNESAMLQSVFTENFNDDLGIAKNVGYIRKIKVPNTNRSGLESIYAEHGEAGHEYSLVHADLNWTFTDNPVVLKTGELRQTLVQDRMRKRSGMETLETVFSNVFQKEKGTTHKPNKNNVGTGKKKDLNEVLRELYPQRNYRHQESLSVRRSHFYSGTGRGVGVSYHIPSESDIPVHVNGEIGKPFGHILLVDPDTGEFLKTSGDVKFYQGKRDAQKGLDSQPAFGTVNEMASHIKQIAQGGDCNFDMEWMVELASAQLEKEFVEGFLNGDLSRSVSITLSEHNKKLFLTRAFRGQGVRCVFVPSEYVTYFATDFSHLGIGKSLVEEAKLQITRLAILDTANILAQIENAISKTELEIGLEKENFDPRQLVAIARDEYFSNNPTLHDIVGYNNVSIDAVIDRFREQSLIIKVNPGDNQNIITPSFEARQAIHEPLKSVDDVVREGLLNTVSGHFGLKRSWLEDTGEGNDFAIEALADQELLRNQTSAYSREFSRFSSDFMRKHVKVNEPLLAEMIEHIRENKSLYQKPDQGGTIAECIEGEFAQEGGKEDKGEIAEVQAVLLDFINNFYVELPQPVMVDTLNKIENKMDAITKLVDAWMEMGGATLVKAKAQELNVEETVLIAQIKGMYLYNAFKRFNLPMPFEEILNDGESGGLASLVNGILNLDGNMYHFYDEYLKATSKNKKKWDKLITKHTKEDSEEESSEPLVTETGFGSEEEFISGGDKDLFADQTLPDGDGSTKTTEVEEEVKTDEPPTDEVPEE